MSNKAGKIEQLLAQAKADTEEKTSVSEAERKFTDPDEAKKTYRHLREKLFFINRWNKESGVMSFTLYNADGKETPEKKAAAGDFVCITLPGTGKNDWVQIIKIDETAQEIILTVSPSFDPTDRSNDKSVTSHFFTDKSTNNFCLRLGETKIKMYVIGLNEETNTEDASNLLESARNLATANLGHYLGFQKAAWTTFCRNFIELKEERDAE